MRNIYRLYEACERSELSRSSDAVAHLLTMSIMAPKNGNDDDKTPDQ